MITDPKLGDRINSGTYARKQLLCRDRFIAWSHRSRFAAGRAIVAPMAGGKLLDYGCGDGTFLALVSDLFPGAVGADLAESHVAECRERFGETAGLKFTTIASLMESGHAGSFDAITCMETLEHCTDESVKEILANIESLLKPGGTLVISVPIEVGPSLIAKEAMRTVAGWRRLGDYAHKERYQVGEFARMVFARRGTAIERPAYASEFAPGVVRLGHGHKGFNWRILERELAKRMRIERRAFSPLGWSGGLLSSQVWLVARPAFGP